MKRLIIKNTIFIVLVILIGLIYFFSNELMRNFIFGIFAGVVCMIAADVLVNIKIINEEMIKKIASTEAFYFDASGRPCSEDVADNMMIVNYDKDGRKLFSVRSKCSK